MANASPTEGDEGNREGESQELARLVAEIARAGWRVSLQVVPNAWGAIGEGNIRFEWLGESKPQAVVEADIQALASGEAPQAPINWKFDPFAPQSIYAALKRFHQLFIERRKEP